MHNAQINISNRFYLSDLKFIISPATRKENKILIEFQAKLFKY